MTASDLSFRGRRKPTSIKIKFNVGVFLFLGGVVMWPTFYTTTFVKIIVNNESGSGSSHLYIPQLNDCGRILRCQKHGEGCEKSRTECNRCKEAKDVLRPYQSRMHCCCWLSMELEIRHVAAARDVFGNIHGRNLH